jgi:ketosteroid isomerase-like protein
MLRGHRTSWDGVCAFMCQTPPSTRDASWARSSSPRRIACAYTRSVSALTAPDLARPTEAYIQRRDTEPAMSENLDLVRSIHAAWERGDYSSAEWAHPEIDFVVADGPTPGSWTGLAGLAEGTRDWLSAWEDARAEVDDYRELDDKRVLVLVHVTGRGKASGLEIGQVQAKGANLFHVRGGKVTRLVLYMDRERALADLGLEH